jgi:microcystin synthetase protein McyJ
MFNKLERFFHNKKIKALYNEIKNDLNDSEQKWLNLGYWKNATTISQAAKEMIELVIQKGELREGHIILDAGIGYGEQDIHILNKLTDTIIYGVNISKHQIDFALRLRKKFNLQNRYYPQYTDVANLETFHQSFDRVISVEAAFHFNTRKDFLINSFKLLKKDGVICITDCLPSNKEKYIEHYNRFKKIGIPKENLYNIEEYVSIMKQVGFTKIEYFDISEDVLPFFIELTQKGKWRNPSKVTINELRKKELIEIWNNDFSLNLGFDKYYVIKGVKSF